VSKFGEDFFRFLSHFPFTCETVTRSVFMINQRNLHFTQVFRVSLSYERITSDIGSLLIPYLEVPLPQALCCTHPDSQTVLYVIMLHPKRFTHHHYHYLSLDHLSYCHSCHLGNVCMHLYTLVHAFCRYTLGC